MYQLTIISSPSNNSRLPYHSALAIAACTKLAKLLTLKAIGVAESFGDFCGKSH